MNTVIFPPRHVLIFEPRRNALLDIVRLMRWEQEHGVVLLICGSLEGFAGFLYFPIEFAIIANSDDPMAQRVIERLKFAGIKNLAPPQELLPFGYFDELTLGPISGREASVRSIGLATVPFVSKSVDWLRFVEEECVFSINN